MSMDVIDFEPLLCGMCPSFLPERRTDGGRRMGMCVCLCEEVSRTDWCHDATEREMQRRAMAAYDERERNKRRNNERRRKEKTA